MEIKTESRLLGRPKKLVFNRLGGQHYGNSQVCSFWLAGTCNRNPCRFRLVDSPPPQQKLQPQPKPKRSRWTCQSGNKFKPTWRNPDLSNSKNVRVHPLER